MKIHRIALPFLILGIVAPGLLAPRAALAGIASTNQVNCAGVNTDNSGCTWKLYGEISYEWQDGADHDRGFNNLVPVNLAEWNNEDLYSANVMDSNVKTMARNITGYWEIDYYSYPYNQNMAVPAQYTLLASTIAPNVTYGRTGEFSEADDVQDVYMSVTSGEKNESVYSSITDSQL